MVENKEALPAGIKEQIIEKAFGKGPTYVKYLPCFFDISQNEGGSEFKGGTQFVNRQRSEVVEWKVKFSKRGK